VGGGEEEADFLHEGEVFELVEEAGLPDSWGAGEDEEVRGGGIALEDSPIQEFLVAEEFGVATDEFGAGDGERGGGNLNRGQPSILGMEEGGVQADFKMEIAK
jgi:hypothetical protein